MYSQLFYLPAGANGRIRESFVRLDRIQAVQKELIQQMPVMLNRYVLGVLRDWVKVYMGEDLETVNDLIFDYRKEAIKQLS